MTARFRHFDFASLHPRDVYSLLASAVVPRPIAWVSTLSEQGVVNLAPFSFFNAVSSSPPVLAFSCTPKPGPAPERKPIKKDTLRNIEALGEFVVNSTNAPHAAAINASAADFEAEESESRLLGLTELPSTLVRPPRIAEAAVQMECKLLRIVEIGEGLGSSALILGQIVAMHVREDLLEPTAPSNASPPHIRVDRYLPLARLGGPEWAEIRPEVVFPLPRPSRSPSSG